MFAGIVETTSAVLSVDEEGRCKRVHIQKPRAWNLSLGESVSIDGICSTVVATTASSFDVEYMTQTLHQPTARSKRTSADTGPF